MGESILVFTHRSIEFLTKLNGSTSWQLNQRRAMLCDYVVCVRNANSGLAEKDFSHGSAFLVGKISNVVQSLNLPRDEHRYMLEFKEYAEILVPKVWKGWRSPVIYKNTSDIEFDLDINFESLSWKEVPKRDTKYISEYFLNCALRYRLSALSSEFYLPRTVTQAHSPRPYQRRSLGHSLICFKNTKFASRF